MYMSIDVGGTKTLVAVLDNTGAIINLFKFPTPKDYLTFKKVLANYVAKVTTTSCIAGCVGLPGRVNRAEGKLIACGNLPWENIKIKNDVQIITNCPIVIENDANLAGLSEAILLKQYKRVLYVTIGTGIGMAVIANGEIEPALADSEGGEILLEHNGKLQRWESFVSGRAIQKRFGMVANNISDPFVWQIIAKDIAIGLADIATIVRPEVIILGGGVSNNFDQFADFLNEQLLSLATPLAPFVPVFRANEPDDAVIYGGYHLARRVYG